MEKFEQLIEFIINDEEEKAKELFHDVVVEKSRDIYEELMAQDEAKAEADAKAVAESDKVESTEDKEVKESSEEVTDEAIETEEEVGGDQADDLISDVEADEEGISEEDGDEEGADAEELEDRVRAATFIGTLQASYTDFHYLRPIWKRNTEKDALIGVSMTGIASGGVLKLNLTEASLEVNKENRRVDLHKPLNAL